MSEDKPISLVDTAFFMEPEQKEIDPPKMERTYQDDPFVPYPAKTIQFTGITSSVLIGGGGGGGWSWMEYTK